MKWNSLCLLILFCYTTLVASLVFSRRMRRLAILMTPFSAAISRPFRQHWLAFHHFHAVNGNQDDLNDIMDRNFEGAKEISSVETSLRLDAIASAGLGISRTRMTKIINEGSIKVDGLQARTVSTNVKEGQVIQAGTLGTMKIMSISITSKGKYKMIAKRLKGRGGAQQNTSENEK